MGLDPEQVGIARLALGVGITGLVALRRRPTTSINVRRDRRFHWIRGVDEPRFTSMCSVPLIWNDQVVGVLNVQTVRRREFTRRDVSFLEALAGLLAGIVERNRLQREAEAQVESLRAIDEARASLIAVVTHALRTPLAVVRAYVELLGGARGGDRRRRPLQRRPIGSARARTGGPPGPDGRLDPGQPARAPARQRTGRCARRRPGGRRDGARAGAAVPRPAG